MQCVPGAIFPGVKEQRLEADHSPPFIGEKKKDRDICIRLSREYPA
jgi:hypothetical protein